MASDSLWRKLRAAIATVVTKQLDLVVVDAAEPLADHHTWQLERNVRLVDILGVLAAGESAQSIHSWRLLLKHVGAGDWSSERITFISRTQISHADACPGPEFALRV
jgi:hypothetical protein